jgi:hypothetical protein
MRIGWRNKSYAEQSRAMLYALELRLRVRCLRDSLIDLDHVRDVIVALRPGLVVTVGHNSHFLGRKWDVAGFWRGR